MKFLLAIPHRFYKFDKLEEQRISYLVSVNFMITVIRGVLRNMQNIPYFLACEKYSNQFFFFYYIYILYLYIHFSYNLQYK